MVRRGTPEWCGDATQYDGQASMLQQLRPGTGVSKPWGRRIVHTAQPRDIGALALVVGVFVILFVLSLMLGSPAR